jgi:hypothetical protein
VGAPAFRAPYAATPFALELSYLRDFTGASIANARWSRCAAWARVSEAQLAQLAAEDAGGCFPNVRRATASPACTARASGAVFLLNGQPLARSRPGVCAPVLRHLAVAQTSEPPMRRALLSQLPSRG